MIPKWLRQLIEFCVRVRPCAVRLRADLFTRLKQFLGVDYAPADASHLLFLGVPITSKHSLSKRPMPDVCPRCQLPKDEIKPVMVWGEPYLWVQWPPGADTYVCVDCASDIGLSIVEHAQGTGLVQ
jgi:hypothetical protein